MRMVSKLLLERIRNLQGHRVFAKKILLLLMRSLRRLMVASLRPRHLWRKLRGLLLCNLLLKLQSIFFLAICLFLLQVIVLHLVLEEQVAAVVCASLDSFTSRGCTVLLGRGYLSLLTSGLLAGGSLRHVSGARNTKLISGRILCLILLRDLSIT